MNRVSRSSSRCLTFGTVFLSLLLFGCEEEPEVAEVIRPVWAMKVQDVEAFAKRYFPGRASATQEINDSFRVAGQLIKRPVIVGSEVKKGDLIAALDPSTYQAEVDRLTAEVASSRAVLERAVLELERQTTLYEKGWTTQARVETLQATEAASRAGVIAARAALERARLDLSYTTLTAPFDGVVVETYVENFQTVLAQQPIVRIVDTSQIEFWVSIPENLISLIPYVRDVTVEFDAFPGRPLSAQIKEIKTEASQITRAFDVNLIMDQPKDFTILPGMAGRATEGRIELPEDLVIKAYEVPLAAIHNPAGDKDYVWVIDEAAMTVSRQEVKQIEPTPRGVRVQGIEPGNWIVTAGVEFLREGQKVRFEQ